MPQKGLTASSALRDSDANYIEDSLGLLCKQYLMSALCLDPVSKKKNSNSNISSLLEHFPRAITPQ